MSKQKTFDCVEMKNAVQATLQKECEGLSDTEIQRRRRQWLETSDNDVARWWRSLLAQKTSATVQ